MGYLRFTTMLLLALISIVGSSFAQAQAQATDFNSWLKDVKKQALAQGISSDTLDLALADLQPLPKVLELDTRQPETTLTFDAYLARTVTPSRIEKGRELIKQHKSLLTKISKKYHVPAHYIVALWGIETDFGKRTGGFSVINALATLAYDGRRASYFRGELLHALHVIDEGHIKAQAMTGSWAGAMGQNQFMPSTFRHFAVDYDGDGRRDIWNTLPDVFASTANYLASSGWRGNQTWGREIRLPANFDKKLIGIGVSKKLSAWRQLGVRSVNGKPLPRAKFLASVVIPGQAGDGTRAFLVYQNFHTLLQWNRSSYFATSVGFLADAIEPNRTR